ncbi:hypothetical protein ACEN88_34990, partial [Massilia sp. CT11-108]|uniref:hypothetical protein n=1 Tax=Massilia sp. CT11-108 TaxID=3393900 RepID=UPI0039A6B58B
KTNGGGGLCRLGGQVEGFFVVTGVYGLRVLGSGAAAQQAEDGTARMPCTRCPSPPVTTSTPST